MTCTHVHVSGTCVNICGGGDIERRREPDRVRWCFNCRKHLMHFAVLMDPPPYYDPYWRLACEGCDGDYADFPGTYRDGPRWDADLSDDGSTANASTVRSSEDR